MLLLFSVFNERTREIGISKVMALFRVHVSVMLPALLLLFFSSSSFGACHAAHGAGLISLKRSLVGTPSFANIIVDNNFSFVLAASRTHRQDPFDDFRYYTGGWNISNVHYWTSVSFTAAPLFVIAVIWFLGFGLVLFSISCYYCCCSRRKHSYSHSAYALSLIFLILFTCAAIIGCIVLYNGQGKFHGSTSRTMDYVVGQADFVVDNLRNFSGILSEAKNISVDQIFIPSYIGRNIDVVGAKLNSSASELETRAAVNSEKIKDKLDTVRLLLIVVAAVMLLLTLLGFYFSVLGQQFLVYILVVIGWVLVTATFILCGVFLIFHNVVTDSCVAMQEWVGRPQAHTSLDDILPCVDATTANESLYQRKEVIYQLSNVINQVILDITNKNFPPNAGPLYYNQSGPLVPVLCNPYTKDLNNATCNTGEVVFSNASQVWKNYVCSTAIVSGSEICTSVGRITPKVYSQMISAVSVSGGLERYGPFLVQLEDCTFVRDTFTTIDENNCPGLNRYSKWIYIGMAMVSSAVMLSLIFWVVYARERQHRANNKQFIALSALSPLPEKTS